jgi:selenocysteine-specific elongation factor
MTPAPADPANERNYILGTAGHIDHGKTALVRALTGVDTDRLPEERRRGMTIELGFAELTIGNTHFGIVDVPGHERFVRTMVAGATGIDLALIVIAADDSVMPQTVEHVEVLHLLDVRRAVVAVTKTDIVDAEMVELVMEEVRDLLADTPLAHAPICPASSVTNQGIEELKQALLTQSEGIEVAPTQKPFRMAVDRVFTVQGRGTVVTGSALRGAVAAGDALEVWPAGETCRVRELQTHGAHRDELGRGQRAAINISGIDREHITRHSELATPGYLQPMHMIDVRLHSLTSYGRALKSTTKVRLGIGTSEVPVRVVLFDQPALEPGNVAFAQLRSGEPITATYGQRFIIRNETATRTIGGGVVLRPFARRKHRHRDTELETLRRLEEGDAVERVEQVLRSAGFVKPTDLQLCARAGVELPQIPAAYEQLEAEHRWVPIPGSDVHAVPAALDDLTSRFTGWLERYHRKNPDAPGRHVDTVLGWLERMTSKALAKPFFERLTRDKTIKLRGQFACLPAFAPQLSKGDEKLLANMIEQIRAGRFQPPLLDALKVEPKPEVKRLERLATLAVASDQLVKIEAKMYLHADIERELRAAVAALIAERGPVTVAEVREAVDTSRKYAVPFLEYLDRVGFTKRIEDRRDLADPGRA